MQNSTSKIKEPKESLNHPRGQGVFINTICSAFQNTFRITRGDCCALMIQVCYLFQEGSSFSFMLKLGITRLYFCERHGPASSPL